MTTTDTPTTAREAVERYIANGGDVERLATAAIEVDPEAANLAVLSLLGENVSGDDVLAVLPDNYVSGIILSERYYTATEVPDWLDVDKVVPSDVQEGVAQAYKHLRRELLRERAMQPGRLFGAIIMASREWHSFTRAIDSANLPDDVYQVVRKVTGADALEELVASVANMAANAIGEGPATDPGPVAEVHHLDVGFPADPVSID